MTRTNGLMNIDSHSNIIKMTMWPVIFFLTKLQNNVQLLVFIHIRNKNVKVIALK